ncbi:MAG TPA: NAD-dependent epimerase/dehydratase family protein [Symbiobacteriaceae bacterium]|nr:NAD-dependent epimerase/dehydratase family protein [Symbiobacteriaceae bacterium]
MILVTGATGFIGAQLAERLIAGGEPVRVLARDPRRVKVAPVEVARGDLGDPASLAQALLGVEQVYHCASWISYKAPWEQVWQVNVQGTANLLDACLAAGVRRVVHMSSVAAGGPARAGRPVTEADEPAPLDDPYGRSKAEQERLVVSYAARGLDVVVVRPSAVYGPGDGAGINLLLKLARRGLLPFYLGSRKTWVNVVPVKDVVAGCLAAMARGRSGEIYNLVGPDLTHEELFALLARVSGGRAPFFEMPAPVLLGAASLVTACSRKPPVHPNDVRSWTANWRCSSEKARAELGHEPSDPACAWAETLGWLMGGSANRA